MMKLKLYSCLVLVMLLGVLCPKIKAQVQSWNYVLPMIKSLDQQLENFASDQYPSQTQVLIAHASIRSRVLARDLLSSGIADPSEAGLTMVYYGTMIFENLEALDDLFKQLPDIKAIQEALLTPTEHQRRAYTLMKPAMERFSQNPINKIQLNVFHAQQVREKVSQAFSPLADILDALRYPFIRNTWQVPSKSMLDLDQIDQLASRFKTLKLSDKELPVLQILDQIRYALELQEFRPLICQTYQMLFKTIRILEVLQKQDQSFLHARPLVLKQLKLGLNHYLQPKKRTHARIILHRILIFEHLFMRIDQLLDQIQDTLPYEELIARSIASDQDAHLQTVTYWAQIVLDSWYEIRSKKRTLRDDYYPVFQIALERWDRVRLELGQLTNILAKKLPTALTPQQEQWLNECHQTRQNFVALNRLVFLMHNQLSGSFKPLQGVTENLLNPVNSNRPRVDQKDSEKKIVQNKLPLEILCALSNQWQHALKIKSFVPTTVFDHDGQAIGLQIDKDINQWVKNWQNSEVDPQRAFEELTLALEVITSDHLLTEAVHAVKNGLYKRLGMLTLDDQTCHELLNLIPKPFKDVSRLYIEHKNIQTLKLNQQRLKDRLAGVFALGHLSVVYQRNMPVKLNQPSSQILSQLIWQPDVTEYDPELSLLCTRFSLMAREWRYQKQQADPRHRRDLFIQLNEIGNKITTRLSVLKEITQ